MAIDAGRGTVSSRCELAGDERTMSGTRVRVIALTQPLPEDVDDPVAFLGGKGASLRKLIESGFNVPLGFTISTEVFQEYRSSKQLPLGLLDEVKQAVGAM